MRAAMLLLVLLTAGPAAADPGLELRWQLDEDLVAGPERGASRVSFTLTNRGRGSLPARGWSVYFNALHRPRPGGQVGALVIVHVVGNLWRIDPGVGFSGLAPGRSASVSYAAHHLPNQSSVPTGPYLVFHDDPGRAHALGYLPTPISVRRQPGRGPKMLLSDTQAWLDSRLRPVPDGAIPLVLPSPRTVERRGGTLRLGRRPAVVAAPGLEPEAAWLREWLDGRGRDAGEPPATITLAIGDLPGQSSPEAHELVIDGNGVRITGASRAGVFRALQSLAALAPVGPPGGALVLPAVRIVDAPRFAYRGLMLDAARNFLPKGQVLRVLDLMARYKLNVLHLHLTDDEGWRVEIEGLPELTSVGARRGHPADSRDHLPPAFGSGPAPGTAPGSGFYSRADYVEIVRAAAARHIQVVPELEMPGHARAAIVAMEARFRALEARGDAAGARRHRLAEPEDRSIYTSTQLYHDNVLNPALPSTYAFIEHVVAALAALHAEAGAPLVDLHMGGDEVPAGVWVGSPAATTLLRELGGGGVDRLWDHFYAKVGEILARHRVALSGWEEIGLKPTRLDGRPYLLPNPLFAARGVRTYVWNNLPGSGAEDLAYRLANAGYKVVLCPVTHLYLDMAWSVDPDEEGLDWGGHANLRRTYEYVPFDHYRNLCLDHRGQSSTCARVGATQRLTDYGKANVVGIQGNLWSETLATDEDLESRLLPRLIALAERAWAKEPRWASEPDPLRADAALTDAYSAFVAAVGARELPRLDQDPRPWRYRIPRPGLDVKGRTVRATLEIPGFTLRYTTDGSEPHPGSPVVRGPLPATPGLRVAAFDRNGRRGASAAPRNLE